MNRMVKRAGAALLLMCAVVVASACSSTREKPQEADSGIDYDLIVDNLLNVIGSDERMHYTRTTYQIVKPNTPIGQALFDKLSEKGYGVQLVSGDVGKNFIRYKVGTSQTEQGTKEVYSLAVQNIRAEREYALVNGKTVPTSPVTLLTDSPAEVEVDDRLFGANIDPETSKVVVVDGRLPEASRVVALDTDSPEIPQDDALIAHVPEALLVPTLDAGMPEPSQDAAIDAGVTETSQASTLQASAPEPSQDAAADAGVPETSQATALNAGAPEIPQVATLETDAAETPPTGNSVSGLVMENQAESVDDSSGPDVKPDFAERPATAPIHNVRELGKSNFTSVFKQYDDISNLTLIFPNDSLFLGDRNSDILMSLAEEINPSTDIISIIGCSHGRTALENGNQLLAEGRTDRVAESLLFAGVQPDLILTEACWASEYWDEMAPRRGVMVTHKRLKSQS